jgi:hypothetical protein
MSWSIYAKGERSKVRAEVLACSNKITQDKEQVKAAVSIILQELDAANDTPHVNVEASGSQYVNTVTNKTASNLQIKVEGIYNLLV